MSTPKRDYYRVLGVRPLDREADIKKAYKELAKKYHPDLNPSARTWAEQKMRELTEAYEVLTDTPKREEYDKNALFNFKIPKFIDPVTKSLRTGPYYREDKPPGFMDKIKALMFVPQEEPPKRELTKKGAEHFALGLSYLDKKKEKMIEIAKMEFEKVLSDAPDNPEGLYNMGLIEYQLGNFDDALAYFSKSQRMAKNDADAKKFKDLLREDE
jgi:curved DNA-binding protein CbpA